MALPKLTDEQRKAALEKAAATRSKRAKTKNAMKSGKLQAATVLLNLEEFDHMKRCSVYHFLKSQPNIGAKTAQKIMYEYKIPESRRLQGLTPRQTKQLLEIIKEYR